MDWRIVQIKSASEATSKKTYEKWDQELKQKIKDVNSLGVPYD